MNLNDTSQPANFAEFDLIDRIVGRLGESAAKDILIPPGDDAAAWALPDGNNMVVASIDTMVEGIHWKSGSVATMLPQDIGWRSVAAAISDLAAMGVSADILLLSVTVAEGTEFIDDLCDGIRDAALRFGSKIAGGDIVRGRETSISVTVIGSASATDKPLMRRDSARVGDVVAVTGFLGSSAGGLALIQRSDSNNELSSLIAAHRRPVASIEEGRLARSSGVLCAIDVSDGLIQDVDHIAQASRVDIEIVASEIPQDIELLTEFTAAEALDFALGGGEDYELVVAAPREIIDSLNGDSDLLFRPIGRVVEVENERPEVRVLDQEGISFIPNRVGWDHGDIHGPE